MSRSLLIVISAPSLDASHDCQLRPERALARHSQRSLSDGVLWKTTTAAAARISWPSNGAQRRHGCCRLISGASQTSGHSRVKRVLDWQARRRSEFTEKRKEPSCCSLVNNTAAASSFISLEQQPHITHMRVENTASWATAHNEMCSRISFQKNRKKGE